MVNMAALASSFQSIGADYDRYRPSFPVEALDLLAPEVVENALDLGAGTGKFTELLVRRAHHVVAVEPSQAMLAVLTDKLPRVSTHLAAAEAIPVATASQDLVTVAQAFHWFDRESACAEISRVLRPGGRLGLLWNNPDPACPWDRAAYHVAHPGRSLTEDEDGRPRRESLPNLERVNAEAIRWEEQISRQDYLRRWLTVSSFLVAKPSVRADMVSRIARILDEDQRTTGREQLVLPHVTEVLLYRKPGASPGHPRDAVRDVEASWTGSHNSTAARTYARCMRCHEVQLSEVPVDEVSAENFAVVETDTGECGDGQVLVGLRRLGLNAGLSHRLGGPGTAYGPGIDVGDVPSSDAVVEVLESNHEGFQPGDLATGKMPWRTAAVVNGDDLTRLDESASEDELNARMTILGHVGFTAWTGIMHIGNVQPDDIVYVSGAAGGVGSCVVQFAKAVGATVIGVAGSDEKTQLLTDTIRADRAINRHDGDATELLKAAAPEGISLYYDNVGGDQLEAALEVLQDGGAIVMCGAVSGAEPPKNLRNFIHKELTMQGFTVTAHEELREDFEKQVKGWVEDGEVKSIHTVFDGIDLVPAALESLLAGGSTGRVIVAVESQRS